MESCTAHVIACCSSAMASRAAAEAAAEPRDKAQRGSVLGLAFFSLPHVFRRSCDWRLSGDVGWTPRQVFEISDKGSLSVYLRAWMPRSRSFAN